MTNAEISKLRKIVALATELIERAERGGATSKPSMQPKKATLTRRTGKELVAFRKMLKAERKRGIPVMEIARKNGISPAYIYQLG